MIDLSPFLDVILTFMMGLPRILAIFSMIPIFGRSVLPGSARNAVATALILFLYPVYSPGIDMQALSAVTLFAIIVKEVVIGLCMGYAFAVLFWAVESMGFIIDNQRGSTMASSVDPLTGAQTSPLGIFFMQALVVFFFVSGASFVLLLAIYESYVIFPVESFYPQLTQEAAIYFLSLTDRILALAVLLAAPAMIAMFLSEFALGLISRFAPQLNVFFLSMSVKSGVGVFVLLLYVTQLTSVWESRFAEIPAEFNLLRGLIQ